MKKLTLLFALLCASVMGFAAIDWSAVDYLGSTEPSISMNTYKYAVDTDEGEIGPDGIANIQPAAETGILGLYTHYGPLNVVSCSHDGKISGTQLWVYVNQLEDKDTKITVTLSDASTRTFHLYYKNGNDGTPVDPSAPHASGKGFGTYIAKDVPFYTRVNNKADDTQAPMGTADLYIVTYGNKMMAKAKLNGGATFLGNGYSMQFRIWNDAQTGFGEYWAQLRAENNTVALIDMNSNYCNLNQGTRTELPCNTYMETSAGTGAVPMFMYTLDYINAPIVGDETAPVISSAVASYSPITGEPTINITATDANDMFYKIVDPSNNVSYSFSNTFQLTTDGSNSIITYTIYAIDFNGNMSSGEAVEVQMKPALSNIALNKSVTAGVNQNKAGRIVDGNFGGERWSSQGAIHYNPTTHPDDYQDWFYINFVNICDLSAVRIKWETARPNNYTFRTSIDGTNWTTVASFTEYPTANAIVDYVLPANTQGRFFGVWATSGYDNLNYGISPFEVEVYGVQAEIEDHNPPTLHSAVLSGEPEWNQVRIAVDAEDAEDPEIYVYHVVDATHSIDLQCMVSEGIITVTGLSGETTYNLSVKAVDGAGNESDAIVVNVTTPMDTSVPLVAAPVPDATGKEIRPIYSDAFASILAHPFDKDGWGGVPLMMEKNISGDNCLIYNVASANEVIWGMYDNGNSAIIAADGYHSADGMGVDASAMTNLHIDIWSLQECTNAINISINDAGLKTLRLSHDGTGWNSYDIALSEFNEGEAGKQKDNVRWFKFSGIASISGKMALDNVYFWAPASGMKSVSASSNNATMGSAVVKQGDDEVTSVAEGSEVSFIATANEGYVFVNWTKGGVEVSTSATYNATITETTNLVANFDYVRTNYCRTEVLTNNNKTLYLSVSKVAADTYKIRIDGSDEARINGRNNFNFVINHTTNYSNAVYDEVTGLGWKVSNEGNGYIENTFSAPDYKALTFGSHYFAIGAQGGGEFILDNNFPSVNTIAWNSTCSDTEAPEMAAPTAVALNTTDVRLTLSATDNWGGTITYNINYKPTDAEGEGTNVQVVGASGEQITKDIEGLTTNTEYTFTITASDGVNVSAAQTCKATPAGDVNAPTNVTISAVALTNTIVRLTLSADDDYAGDITYNIAYDNAGEASTSAAQGTSTTLDITGLDADAEYHFSVVATDAANNSSAAVNASAVRTYAENLALNKDCEAGYIALPKAESNDGNKGSRWASGGSAVHGDDISTSQDWWYVDLGHVYDIKNIRMFWEGARPSKYKFFTSNDAITWTEIANLLVSPSYSANASAVMDYLSDINADAQGRYVKVWGYEDTNNNWAYGISFWELEVYGTLAVDGVAPVINSFEAAGASTTSVLLKATADDNFKGDLTYTFYCNDAAQGEPVVKAAGVEATMTVNGLTMGTNYNFKVNVSDGTNNTMSDVVVGTPINDNQAPENVTVTSEATDHSITLTLSATDNLGGMIYYTVTCGETVKNAEALSGAEVNVLFDGLDYDTPYAFSVVAKDGSENAADAVAHNKSTIPATYPTSSAPAPAFAEASVRPVFSSAYNKDCNFYDWGGSWIEKQTYGAKKAAFDKAYFGIADFGTIKVDADDELYLSVWTNEDIQFRVVPIIRNADNTANLPERGAFTETLTGGQWNVVHFTMSDFILDGTNPAGPNENYDKIYQIKIDQAGNQTFWLDNIYFRRHGALNETDNAEFIAANNNEGQDITIPRTFPLTTEWYTLCLPFDLSDEQLTEAFGAGYTLATLANSVDHGSLISLNFDFVHSFEAGKAYLLRPGTAVTENPLFEGVVVKNVNPEDVAATSTLMNFQGTYNTIVLNSENQRFVGPENYLYSPAEGGTTMKAFRCFFSIPQNSPLNGAPGRPARIVFGEQTATGMESVQGDDVQSVKVLMDGQLFIIREGRTYNAQGILVK